MKSTNEDRIDRSPRSNRAHPRRRERGFSLVEILTVIAIIGLVAAVAIPAFMQLLPQYRAKAAAVELSSYIGLARQNALTTGRPTKVTYDITNNRYSGAVLNGKIIDMDAATVKTTLQTSGNWKAVDPSFKEVSSNTTQWRPLSGIAFATSTANNFNDVDGATGKDIIFLGDGTVATTPDKTTNTTTDLTFSPEPEVIIKANSNLVTFNRYKLRLKASGAVSVAAVKE